MNKPYYYYYRIYILDVNRMKMKSWSLFFQSIPKYGCYNKYKPSDWLKNFASVLEDVSVGFIQSKEPIILYW